jgi:photosystem II stability/assembly factor-like uncharacterized protein
MHALASVLLAVVCLLAGPATRPLAAADGWVPAGPPGGPVPHLIVHPRDPRVLWAGTQSNGIYKSVDGGASWRPANQGLTTMDILALAVAPSAPDTLYLAAGRDGVFRSIDGGATWEAVLPCRQQPFPCCGCVPLSMTRELVVHLRDPRTVFATTSRGVFKSVDGGAQWRRTSLDRFTHRLVADPRNPNVLYAGTLGSASFKSSDGGKSWVRWSAGLPSSLTELAIDPADPRRMWIAAGGRIYRSTDGGVRWRHSSDLFATALVVAPARRGQPTVYAGTSKGVFRSLDGGLTWNPVSQGLRGQEISVLAVHASRPGTLWAGTGPNVRPFAPGIFKSVNGGATWSFSSRGFFNEPAVTLAFDPVHPGVLWVGSPSYLVQRSPDGGATWTSRSGNLVRESNHRVDLLVADPADPATLWAGTNKGVWITEDGGALWEARNEGLLPPGGPRFLEIKLLRVAPSNAAVAYVSIFSGLFKTVDQGRHWTRLNGPFEFPPSEMDVLIDPRDPDVLYVAAENLWVSRDGGLTWTELHIAEWGVVARRLAADPRDPDVLYLAAEDAIYRRSDRGGSWEMVAQYSPSRRVDIAVAPTGEVWAVAPTGDVWSAGPEGVLFSPDGLTWTLVPGLPGPVTTIEIDPHAPPSAFAGTSGGFFRHE